MADLAAPVAALRNAVRHGLRTTDLPDGALVLVACSGGADSLALAAATAFVAPRIGLRAGLVTIDHRLQEGSTERAVDVVTWAAGAGLAPTSIVTVDATPHGDGPEAAARAARYDALSTAAARDGAAAVVLGHTRDDQAETVLLALARGSGVRGLSGMPARRDIGGVPFLRPLLDVSRADTVAACAELGLVPWIDPHNDDPRFARSRVRAALPLLTELLGAGVVPNLARTAGLVAADSSALDDWATAAAVEAYAADDGSLRVEALAEMPAAIRTRVLRVFALRLGTTPSALSRAHIAALDALVVAWRGQGAVALPGGILVARRDAALREVVGAGIDGSRRGAGSPRVDAEIVKAEQRMPVPELH
ncbi:MAG TPA: tRNA lysidine(34) synthetase TilS, partial [Micromonosporaceae bacterium]